MTTEANGKPAFRWRRLALMTLTVAVLLAAGWWAGRVTVVPRMAAVAGEPSSAVAVVTRQSVGRALSLVVTVRQPFAPVAVNGLAGTVTSTTARARATTGDTVYTVDRVPVRVVEGTMPFYRALATGATGPDVRQLQRALAALGHYSGGGDGRYDAVTATAVRRWQRSLGTPATGSVASGELIAVPTLPAPIRLGEPIVRGARLVGGEPAVLARSGTVDFALVVSEAQAALIPPTATIVVSHAGRSWPAKIVDSSVGAERTVRYILAAPTGGPVCGAGCAALPAGEHVSLPAKVTLVPQASGPTVPVAAVRTDPGGRTHVLMADGTRRDVSVVASSGGLAVVEGLTDGERVLMFGGGPATGAGR